MFKAPKPTALSKMRSTKTGMKTTVGRSGSIKMGKPTSKAGSTYMKGGAPVTKKAPTTAKGAMNSYRTSKVVSAKTHSTPMSKKPIRSGKYC